MATPPDRSPDMGVAVDPQLRATDERIEPAGNNGRRTLIIVGFLAVVFAVTGLAMNSHRQAPGEAAIVAPPGAPGTPTAPVETTGAAPAKMPAPLPAPPAQ